MLPMARPTRHPRTGTYRLRKAIPAPLRDTASHLFGARAELIESLGTKDPREAKARAPAALARLEGKLTTIRRAASGDLPALTERDVQAIAGNKFRDLVAQLGDDPGDRAQLEEALSVSIDRYEETDDHPHSLRELRLRPNDLEDARQSLIAAGFPADSVSIRRVAEACHGAMLDVLRELSKRAHGDWRDRPDLYPVQKTPQAAIARCTVDDLLKGWAADRGWSVDAKPMDRNLYDRFRTLERLSAFIGHRDASAITKADAVQWKTEAQQRGLSPASIRNDLSEMSSIWRWGLANGLALPHGNPFEGILPAKPKRRATPRTPFTNAEASAILNAAREQTGALRWLPWVCALTGARVNEIVQSTREDILDIDGISCVRIHDDGDKRSVKNADSRRMVPLHPALVAEGFRDYVRSLPARSPLFPDVRPDSFGRRSSNASKLVSRWLRNDLGITRPGIAPNHSWRHWFIDACRAAQLNPEIRSALTGHSARLDESGSYGAGAGSFVRLLAAEIAKVKLPEGVTVGKTLP